MGALSTATILCVLAAGAASGAARAEDAPTGGADAPAWFKRKKDTEEGERRQEELKASEKAAVGGADPPPAAGDAAFSTLTQDDRPAPQTNLLFKSAGLTESFDLGAGSLSQDDLAGFSFTPAFAMGWWWTPRLIASVGLSGLVQLKETYVFGLLALGPKVRWLLGERWILGAGIGYGVSQGLSRVPQSHIPPPPGDPVLEARLGPSASLQAGVLFWPRRDLGIGPSVTYTIGKHAERSFSIVTVGISYQSGRPNYTGSVR
jgi:hypothetical protein